MKMVCFMRMIRLEQKYCIRIALQIQIAVIQYIILSHKWRRAYLLSALSKDGKREVQPRYAAKWSKASRGMSSERGLELRQLWHILTKADVVLVVAVAVWAGGLVATGNSGQRQGTRLVVEVSGSAAAPQAMSPARVIQVQGPLGVTEIEIGADGARVSRAPCRNQICVRAGWIRRTGEITVCIPNRVLLRFVGHRPDSSLDAVSR